MADPIRIRARSNGGITEVMVLMPHPMETGLGLDASGRGRRAHYISDVEIKLGDRTVLRARLSIAVSKDPLISFRFKGGGAGDRIGVTWTDNFGDQGSGSASIV
ncbi:MAG: thiosulfate oxidation carrier complex protein SoxZ [Gammaproteobacteria bacterium]|jgi:sulfur-oxidizing protein SoxZ|uniref:thiosulfate oxidation carrier complex protein SoxZ n=1 Tax=Thiocapsa sp. UBA6158 TaxID=1947692 RepID=UPI0025E55B3D|nr:thiosulfate oxidation carrier complex protein SoxZ [Thiocapsa sp. UBA6158]NCC29661.1 thiosulfate oxidation carrier complex protein SoxZ [Gammaproteobacteria bacterium]